MVSVNTLDDDFYIFDEKNYCLVGRHSHRTYQLGDDVRVEISRTNLEKKQLDFRLIQAKSRNSEMEISPVRYKKKGRR